MTTMDGYSFDDHMTNFHLTCNGWLHPNISTTLVDVHHLDVEPGDIRYGVPPEQGLHLTMASPREPREVPGFAALRISHPSCFATQRCGRAHPAAASPASSPTRARRLRNEPHPPPWRPPLNQVGVQVGSWMFLRITWPPTIKIPQAFNHEKFLGYTPLLNQ